jgi:hypothetical protein
LKTAIRCALDRLIPSFLRQIQQQSNALGKKNVRKKSVIPIGTQTGGKPPSKNGRHRRGRPFDLPGEVLPAVHGMAADRPELWGKRLSALSCLEAGPCAAALYFRPRVAWPGETSRTHLGYQIP